MTDIIDDYFKLLNEVYKYFGYIEDWCIFPVCDERGSYWFISKKTDKIPEDALWYDKDAFHGEIICYDKPITKDILIYGEFYELEIYTQRFLRRWVYRTEKYTMALVDTHSDGNRYLAIFDNAKEQPEFSEKTLRFGKF